MTLSATDFELLLQANRILSSKLRTDDVLQAVMELATKVVRAEASSLLLLDAATNELYFDVALGSAKDAVKQIRLKVGEGIAGWVANERRPLIVNDVSQDKRFSGKADKSTSFKTKSILAVPLLAKGRLVGVVEALNKEMNGIFSDQDREAFEVFASQAAVAIENARLFSEVTREREKLHTVFAQMSDGVILLDFAARVLLINDAASRLLGMPREKAEGNVFDDKLLTGFQFSVPLAEVIASKNKVTEIDITRRAVKDLTLGALVMRLAPDDHGQENGFLVMLRDLTEERRGEMLKRNFLSLISHKLKTPLTVILGYAPMLRMQTDNLNDAQKKAVKAIGEQGEHLNGLVDKLLRFTIVESESLDRKIEPKELEPLVAEAVKAIAPDQEHGSVNVDVTASVRSVPSLMVDGNLMVEVFKNVIENAIKFNDKPKKEISITAEKKNGSVLIHIHDNGVGIPPEEREKVFQKFYQVENSFTGQIPGAGLGLALCKKVVEAMGGTISIESTIGVGTDVVLSLPEKKRGPAVAC